MLKIRAVKIEVNTTDGLFGTQHLFKEGLNIIRGDNSTGKSTLFQAIIYCLGLEELLGGKNEKTMQSTLKDQVEYPKGSFHNIIQSFIYLEIENKNIFTIKRSIISETRKSQLIDVYQGPLITGNDKKIPSMPMYIHDKGGASDEVYGFHMFLSELLNWDLPEVVTSKGDLHKLYIQQIAPAFIIEQKSGWSDFFSTIPFYNIKDVESRVIEFLLDLDVFENEKRKQGISIYKQEIKNSWYDLFSQFYKLAESCSGTLKGLESTPSIMNDYEGIYITVPNGDTDIPITEYNEIKKKEFFELETKEIKTVGEDLSENEIVLKNLSQQLSQISLNYEVLSPELNFDKEKLNQYEKQLVDVEDDLVKNKGALKIKKLGAVLPSETANDVCPTCHQTLKESLLPYDIKQLPMRLEDNISYLEAQKRMLEVYIEGQIKLINEKEKKLNNYQRQIIEVRQKIRDIKKRTRPRRKTTIIFRN